MSIGMSKREIERELAWRLRSPPTDPNALAQLFKEALATIVDMNNQRIAEQLARDESVDGAGEDW